MCLLFIYTINTGKIMANTILINTPTRSATGGACAATHCAELGPTDPLNKAQLGPRRQRELVREQLKDFVLLMLGAPAVAIELDQQQLDLAVDQALKIFEDYCPREYFDYYVFQATPGKSVYELPPDVGLVRNVFYKTMGNFAFQASDLDGAIPIEYFYPGGAYASIQGGLIDPIQPIWGRMGEWSLYKMYERMYSRISSNLGGWEWVSGFRHIKLYPTPFATQKVIVHYLQKQKDWNEVTEAMQMGALAYGKIMLGRIRSKFEQIPGPGGGGGLDGNTLLQEGREDLEKWRENLIIRYGDILPIDLA
jgi:hypothetical protein